MARPWHLPGTLFMIPRQNTDLKIAVVQAEQRPRQVSRDGDHPLHGRRHRFVFHQAVPKIEEEEKQQQSGRQEAGMSVSW